MRKNILIGNWKMNLENKDSVDLVNKVLSNLADKQKVDLVFAPSFTELHVISNICANYNNVFVAAQDCSVNTKGAFTGEVSASMIAAVNVSHVILGHSERRQNFDETNIIIEKKIVNCLSNNLKVVFCCGESLDQRKKGEHFDWIRKQISDSLFSIPENQFSNVIIAYEPIWAIGTGMNAKVEEAQEMHSFIRSLISEKYGDIIASNTLLIYGGSCNPSNSLELFEQTDIDGGLIGGASLKADSFLGILDSFQ